MDNGSVSHTPTTSLALVYIIGSYPGLTKTFIDREIKMLRRWGADLQIVSIRHPPADTPLSRDQQELQQEVTYLLPVAWITLVLSQLYFALLLPQRYFRTLIYLLTRSHPDFRARCMTVLHFAEGVYAAYLLRKRPFDELHAHFVDRAATVALVVGRLLNKPFSASIHAGPDIFVNPVLLREKITEARHIATCTLYNKSHVEGLVGCNLGDKISYIHHGLELAKYHPPAYSKNGRPLILSVGQLAERKGFAHLINACRHLKDRGYDFACHIVGHGPQHDELTGLIKQLGLETTVTLCGALPHEDVIEKYRSATMFVLPCHKSRNGDMDGFPNVLAEAMAMEVPVISTDVSAIPELLHDHVNGLMVPSEDLNALVNAIACLLEDPSLCETLGKRGRQSIIATFDVEHNVRRFATTLWPNWMPQGINHSTVDLL